MLLWLWVIVIKNKIIVYLYPAMRHRYFYGLRFHFRWRMSGTPSRRFAHWQEPYSRSGLLQRSYTSYTIFVQQTLWDAIVSKWLFILNSTQYCWIKDIRRDNIFFIIVNYVVFCRTPKQNPLALFFLDCLLTLMSSLSERVSGNSHFTTFLWQKFCPSLISFLGTPRVDKNIKSR